MNYRPRKLFTLTFALLFGCGLSLAIWPVNAWRQAHSQERQIPLLSPNQQGAARSLTRAAAVFATITVNNSGTAIANDGVCTLPEAIIAANTDTASGAMAGECAAGSGADMIELPANATITLTAAHNNFYGPTGLPPISSVITINGNGATIERSSAGGTPNFRFFYVSGGGADTYNAAGDLTLRNVTLRNGREVGGAGGSSRTGAGGGGGGGGLGGAIFNRGGLHVFNSTLTGNMAQGGAGGNRDSAATGGGGGGGGGISGSGGNSTGSSGGGGGGGGFAGNGGSTSNTGGGGGAGLSGNGGTASSTGGAGGGGFAGDGGNASNAGGAGGGGRLGNGGTASSTGGSGGGGVAGNGGNSSSSGGGGGGGQVGNGGAAPGTGGGGGGGTINPGNPGSGATGGAGGTVGGGNGGNAGVAGSAGTAVGGGGGGGGQNQAGGAGNTNGGGGGGAAGGIGGAAGPGGGGGGGGQNQNGGAGGNDGGGGGGAAGGVGGAGGSGGGGGGGGQNQNGGSASFGAGGGGAGTGGVGGSAGVGGGGGGGGQNRNGGAGNFGGGGGGAGVGGVGGAGGFGGGGAGGGQNQTGGASSFGGGTGGNGNNGANPNGGGGGGGAGMGGAIFNDGGTLEIRNSTISGNASIGGAGGTGANNGIAGQALGGGVFIRNGSVTINNATFNNNTAANGGGSLYTRTDSGSVTLTLTNTILSNTPAGTDCFVNGAATTAGSGTNLIESNGAAANACPGVLTTTDPALGALMDEAPGNTETHAITNTSPAYNTGNNATCEATDQRGVSRPQAGTCDIGAYELAVASNADLAITKTDGVTTATPGGSVTYTITASNAGPAGVTGATVADTFPAILTCTWTCVGAGGGTCTAAGAGNINDTVNLPAGGSVTYTASCSINPGATGTLSNTATVSSGTADPNPGNNSATDTDTLTPQADLAITKTDGVATAVPGQSVTYTITASNAGPSTATGATVADTFPAILTCTWTSAAAGGATGNDANGSGNISDSGITLPPGGSVTYTASCSISASATGTLSNTATVSSGVTDPSPGNNSATDTDTLTPQADLSITKTDGLTTVVPGQSVTYTITASNAGPSNAPGSTVADTFPASLTCTWTCVGAGGGTCTAAGSGNINDTVNLPSGGSVTYTASCMLSPSATGTLSNTATVSAGGGVTDPSPGNNSATDTDTIQPCPTTLIVNDLGDAGDANPGDAICATSGNVCTLRAAVEEANASPACSPLTINIVVPGTINLATKLPFLNHPNLTINGPGASLLTVRRSTIAGTPDFNIFTITGAIVRLAGLTISNGKLPDGNYGGGLDTSPGTTVTLDGCVVSGNSTVYFGGGIASIGGTLILNNCLISGNQAGNAGGVWMFGGNLTMSNSTISGNTTGGQDGGILFQTGATGTLTNSTISGNTAGSFPGGLRIIDGNTVTLTNCTVTDNRSNGTVGGIEIVGSLSALRLQNTIVANNVGPNLVNNSGTVTSLGNNLTSDNGGGFLTGAGDLINTNPLLAPLGNNGGPTPTHLLLPGSPAIDNGGAGVTTDQRGLPRPFDIPAIANAAGGNGSDIGAVEIQCSAITLAGLAAGTAGVPYTPSNIASGGTAPYTLSLTGGSLPPGVTISGNGLTGTPTMAGLFSFTLLATDAYGCTGSQSYTVSIGCPAITLSPAALPNAMVNVAYPQTITASPAGTYSFSVTNGLLPTGLTLNGNGTFSGAPTQSGVFNFRVTAAAFGSCSSFVDYVLLVNCAAITVSPSSLPGGTVGAAYNQTVSASPAGSYVFSVTAGSLPPGLSLNPATGAITGTPTGAGEYSFDVTASAGGCAGSRNYLVAISCTSASFTTTTLPTGTAGNTYSQTLSVSPAGIYTFSLTQGNLPSGLTLNPFTGVISGLSAVTGTTTFIVKAEATSGCIATQAYTLTIGCPAVTVNPASLPNGSIGVAYSQSLSASPAGGNYSFALTSGNLPAGLNLNPATGSLSGSPTTNGTFTFTITATGFGGCMGSTAYAVTIGNGGCPTITLPASLPNGSVGQLYNHSAAASPAGLYSYEVTAGSLPPGTTVYTNIGLVFGYPTAAGSYSFTITATQGACFASQSYTVLINAGFASSLTVFSDFDGDGKSDLSVFRGSDGNWLVESSGDGQLQATPWGASYEPYNDVTVSGDYDGDGKTDLAVFRRGGEYAGYWFIKQSSDGQVRSHFWGLPTDIPVPGDYDADGKTDVAVWRGSAGAWYVLRSSDGGVEGFLWGAASAGDIPVPGDYDGDQKTDLAVFRKSDGHWYIKRSSDGSTVNAEWGLGIDLPVPGDYDGDGRTDLAIWRASDGNWHIQESGSGALRTVTLGLQEDVPVLADYDGDGKADPALWRTSTGTWLIKRSTDGAEMTKVHGQSGDTPVMARKN